MEIKIKSCNLNLSKLKQLQFATLEEFQTAQIHGWVLFKNVPNFLLTVSNQNGIEQIKLIVCDMWEYRNMRGWVDKDDGEHGLSWCSCGKGQGKLFKTLEERDAYVSGFVCADKDRYEQLFF